MARPGFVEPAAADQRRLGAIDQLVRVKSAAEADVYNALIGGETLARDIYRGPRGAGVLTRNDVRTIQPYRVVAIQLRRSF